MSGLIQCCGIRWSQGTWSDALFGTPDVGASLDGKCGKCGQPLAGPEIITLCGEPLCFDPATHVCHVIGGPDLQFCKPHAQRMQAAALEAGVASKIVMRPPVALNGGGS
jgi:hypothetical protein